MPSFCLSKLFPALAICFFLIIFVFADFLAQNSQPSPGSSPSPSPTASVTPTPARVPTPTPLPGAQNFHRWGSLTVFNGLPSDSVRAVAQTPDGVMWFGTDNGLARFDGRRIQNFSLGSSPDANRVLTMKTDASGGLWIGTRAGAFVYSDGHFEPVEGTQDVGITSILLGTSVFLGTDSGLVHRFYALGGKGFFSDAVLKSPFLSAEGEAVGITSLLESGGKLLAGTAGNGVFAVENGGVSEYVTTPRPTFVNALAKSETGQLWFGTEAAKGASGIFQIDDRSRAQRIKAPTADVTALEINESGLWAATERFGLFHVTDTKLKKNYTFENTSGGLRSDNIFTLFTDREGVIWIGTNRGVSRFDRLGPMQQTVSEVANSNFIRTLFRSANGTIYAGSNRGLFVQNDDKWTQVAAYANRPIYALAEERSGKLIVGSNERANPPSDVRSFADFQGVKYAAIAGAGLAQVGSNGYNIRHADASVNALCAAGDKLWIGTAGNGLFSFDGRSVRIELSPDMLKSGAIWRIFENPDRSLWIAGQHGVFRLKDGQPERIFEAEEVRDVFVDGENVWAATTTRGLMHARQDERFGWLVSSVAFEQGLPSEKAFSILPVEEGLLIATNRGVVTYKPGSITPKLIATRVLSQRVHDLAELRSTIGLDYPQDSLLVEVAGQSSRTFPEEFQYAFVLKNAGGDVLDKRISNEPQYAPADLKPGDYAIEAIAFDRDLLASEPLTVRFSVAKSPFPWTATALGILLAIAIVALIWAIIERGRIITQSRELAAARLDLAHEAERERSRIARDLHDQTLADLRDLIMKSDKTLPPGAGFRDDIESISTEIRRICEDLSPSVLENVGFIASLEFLLSHTIENYRFDDARATDEQISFPVNVQLQIYRIAQEVLTNVKRHADAKLVEMQVSVPAPGSFELTIVNDGKPFTPPEHSNRAGRGIAGIRSRASLIHASAKWDKTSDGRPRFRLSL
jgi:signal transduction histidine kinase